MAKERAVLQDKPRLTAARPMKKWQAALAAFAEASDDGFILFDADLNLLGINPAAVSMVGLSEKAAKTSIGRNILDLSPDMSGAGRYEEYLNVLKTGEPFVGYDIMPHPKFGGICLSVRAFRVEDGLGIVASNLTARKCKDEALQERELRGTKAPGNTPGGILLVDLDGRLAYVNKACEGLLGYKPGELVGTSAFGLLARIGSKDREGVWEVLKEVMEEGGAEAIDMCAITKTGGEIPVSVAASVIVDEEGSPKNLVVVMRGITAHKRVAEALCKRDEYFRALIENSLDGIAILDDHLVIRYESPSSERILGYKPEELIGRSAFEFL
ncbi:MAG: PAS domain S-box protein, partial [Dehalococcoidia bacterium]